MVHTRKLRPGEGRELDENMQQPEVAEAALDAGLSGGHLHMCSCFSVRRNRMERWMFGSFDLQKQQMRK